MLMVNALFDPETSYTWAVDLRGQIPGAVLLTRNGDGKTLDCRIKRDIR
jgi:hypothetical protein